MRNAISVIEVLVRVGIWSLTLLLIFENLGFDVTALVAGLGIGGVAVALAAQRVLGDLFSSLAIVLDRPCVRRSARHSGEDRHQDHAAA